MSTSLRKNRIILKETYFIHRTDEWLIFMKQGIMEILKDIFASAGYRITDSCQYDLIAEKNDSKTYIKFTTRPEYDGIINFADQIQGQKGLLIVTDEVSDDMYHYALEHGIMIWDRNELAFQIGKAVLCDIEDKNADIDFVQEPVNGNISASTSTMQINASSGGSRSENAEIHIQKIPQKNNRMSQEGEQLVSDISTAYMNQKNTSESRENLKLRALSVNTSKEHALAVAKPHIGNIEKTVLKFVPFWKYTYMLSVEKRYKSKIIDISGDGDGCLNAINGNNEPLSVYQVNDQIPVPDTSYKLESPIIKQDEAYRQLIKMIIDEHTKDVRFDNTIGEAIISEHKRFRPGPDDIELNMEMIYVPIWEFKGRRNSIEINAYNGEVLNNPVGDDVEFM